MKASERARFDTKLPIEQKERFEYAAQIGGFRTLTEFIIFSAQQQANLIIEKNNSILASKRDQEIFFNALMNPESPNSALQKAALNFNQQIAKK